MVVVGKIYEAGGNGFPYNTSNISRDKIKGCLTWKRESGHCAQICGSSLFPQWLSRRGVEKMELPNKHSQIQEKLNTCEQCNKSAGLVVWGNTWWLTLERSLILVLIVKNHLGKQEVWGLTFWLTLHCGTSNEIKDFQVFEKCPNLKPLSAAIFDPILFKPFLATLVALHLTPVSK